LKTITFLPAAFKDYIEWSATNRPIFDKINELLKEIQREPFKGTGKPEPLKGNYKGSWSRRINSEHRLVYSVKEGNVIVITCHGHYD
jgi:toxin YoeB